VPFPRPSAAAVKTPSITREQGVTVIALGSEYENLNEAEIESLKGTLLDAALQADPPVVLLDLSNLKIFGSSFIEALFRMWNHVNSRPGGQMSLCGLTSYCKEVVEITHLDQLWSIFETREEALRNLRQA